MHRALRVTLLPALAVVATLAVVLWKRHRPDAPGGRSETTSEPLPQAGADLRRPSISGTVRSAGRPVAASVVIGNAGAEFGDTTDADSRDRRSEVAILREATVVARASSSVDGRFEARGLGRGLYVVRASTEDGSLGSTLLGIDHEGEHVDVDVEALRVGDPIRAKIVGGDGRPFREPVTVALGPAIHVSVASWGASPFVTHIRNYAAVTDVTRVTPDEDGVIEIAGLPRGAVELAVAEGPIRVRKALAYADEARAQVEMPAPIPIERGVRFVEKATGRPLAGMPVTWSRSTEGSSVAIDVVTDVAGRVPTARLGFGCRVGDRGLAPWNGEDEWPQLADPRVARLERGATIRGRVVRSTSGLPVEGHVVEVFDEDDSEAYRPLARTVTAVDGGYVIAGLPAGDLGIRVRGVAGIARGMTELDASDARRDRPLDHDPLAVNVLPGREATLDVVMEPGARIVGRVTDASGAAVAGVVVRASGSPRYAMSSSASPPPFWEVAETVSGPDGRYAIEGLLPITYRVRARRGAERSVRETKAVGVGADSHVDLVFPPSVVLDLHVVDDSTGAGVAGVPLAASLVDEPDSMTAESAVVWHARSGEGGHVHFGRVRRTALEFRVAGKGWSLLESRMPAPVEGAVATVTLRVEREPSGHGESFEKRSLEPRWADEVAEKALRVHVAGPDGEPVPDARILLRQDHSVTGPFEVSGGSAFVARSGRRPIEVLAFAARAADGAPLPFGSVVGAVRPEETEIRVVMPKERAVEGRIVDERGRGVPGINVRVRVPGLHDRFDRFLREVLSESRTDTQGAFRVGGLHEEAVELIVVAPRSYEEVAPILFLTAGAVPIEIRLRPSADRGDSGQPERR